jgi:hypothetical protein
VIVAVHLLFQINGDGETNCLEGAAFVRRYLDSRDLVFLPAGERTRVELDRPLVVPQPDSQLHHWTPAIVSIALKIRRSRPSSPDNLSHI